MKGASAPFFTKKAMTIKNIKLIEGLIPQEQLEKLDYGAALHLRNARIHFKVLEVGDDYITVQVVQTKAPAENYLSAKALSQRAKDLFGNFFPDKKVHARPATYVPPSVDHATPGWIARKLEEKGISQSDIVEFTGVDKTNISAWISGKRPMSQPVKAMFYLYLTQK